MTEIVCETPNKASFRRQRVRVENILDVMYRYRVNPLSDAQYTAGLKFFEIYNRARNGPSFNVLCSPYMLAGGAEAGPEMRMISHVDCSRYLSEAYKSLTEEEQQIVRKVCGHDEYPNGKREHKLVRIALDKLARFWGYI